MQKRATASANLHHYDGELYGFRQYEVDGKVGYESCEGTLNGKRDRLAVHARATSILS